MSHPTEGDAIDKVSWNTMNAKTYDIFKQRSMEIWRPRRTADPFTVTKAFFTMAPARTVGGQMNIASKIGSEVAESWRTSSRVKVQTVAEITAEPNSSRVEVITLQDVIQLLQITAVFSHMSENGRKVWYQVDHSCHDEWYTLETKFYAKASQDKKDDYIQQGQIVYLTEEELSEVNEVLYTSHPKKNTPHSSSQSKSTTISEAQDSRAEKRRQCFVCKEVGHWKKDCLKQKAKLAGQNQGKSASSKKPDLDKGSTMKTSA